MRYVGIVEGGSFQHMCALEEVRTPEPPIRLQATFFEPGSAYGPNGEGFFRISLTVPDARLAEAVERLRDSLAAG